MATINILSDFSVSPGPRYCKQGAYSGEEFYHKLLNDRFAQAYQSKEQLELNLDGTDGYMSSFLDEAIGNLVYDFGPETVNKVLRVVSNEEKVWITLIQNEIIPEWSRRILKQDSPIKTSKQNHGPWYRLNNNKLERKVWIQSV